MLTESIKTILFTIGILFSNPFVPDYGLQLAVAIVIGLILPEKIVNPLNEFVLLIPGVKKFEKFLSKNKKLKTIIPRIFAGYFFTYVIAGISLVIAYFL